jgi:hypothetical protein
MHPQPASRIPTIQSTCFIAVSCLHTLTMARNPTYLLSRCQSCCGALLGAGAGLIGNLGNSLAENPIPPQSCMDRNLIQKLKVVIELVRRIISRPLTFVDLALLIMLAILICGPSWIACSLKPSVFPRNSPNSDTFDICLLDSGILSR